MSILQTFFVTTQLAGPYWFSVVTLSSGSTTTSSFVNIVNDLSSNTYLFSRRFNPTTGTGIGVLFKCDSSGNLLWQKNISGGTFIPVDIYIDSNNNIICLGNDSVSNFFKFDSSGNLLTSFKYPGLTSNTLLDAQSFILDSANNIYTCGSISRVVKINSSQAIQFQYWDSGSLEILVNGQPEDFRMDFVQIKTDNAGNIYAVGKSEVDYGSNYATEQAVLAKYNSSGNIVWIKVIGDLRLFQPATSYVQSGDALTIDGIGNIYVIGSTFLNYNDGLVGYITKYNSSGVVEWQRTLGTAYGLPILSSVVVDSNNNNNIYVSGSVVLSVGVTALYIAKYNSSGVIQWQRQFRKTSSSDLATAGDKNIQVDSQGNLLIAFDARNSSSIGILKVPSDGSLTGTYGSYVYESVNYTSSSASRTDVSYTFTQYSLSISAATSTSYTAANSSYSSSLTNM